MLCKFWFMVSSDQHRISQLRTYTAGILRILPPRAGRPQATQIRTGLLVGQRSDSSAVHSNKPPCGCLGL